MTRLGVDDLLLVANTRHGPGGHIGLRGHAGEPMHDHLVDPGDAWQFLVDHRVAVPASRPTAPALDRMRLIRRHVRALAGDRPDGEHPDEAGIRELFERYPVRLGAEGELRPAAIQPTGPRSSPISCRPWWRSAGRAIGYDCAVIPCAASCSSIDRATRAASGAMPRSAAIVSAATGIGCAAWPAEPRTTAPLRGGASAAGRLLRP